MFKVGDKVKVVDVGKSYTTYKDFIKENAPQLLNKWEYERGLPNGGSYEVKAVGKHTYGNELAIIEQNNKVYIVDFQGLELVKQFTKSDLKDNHIVIFEDGYKRLWGSITNKDNYKEDLTHKGLKELNINEVWEFDKLVWKREEKLVEILDEVEKKYLSYVVKPFKNEIIWIKKNVLHNTSDEEWIKIKMNEDSMIFPSFKKGKMYKGMEIYKEYSLKELGLED